MMMRTLRMEADQTTARSRNRSGVRTRSSDVTVSARPSHNVVGNHGALRRADPNRTTTMPSASRSKTVRDGSSSCRKPGCPCRLESSDLRLRDGRPAVSSLGDQDRIQIDDNPNPSTGGGSGGSGTTPACPTDIRVVEVGELQLDDSMAEQGWLTGWGGYAKMEVSDPSGRDWNGTDIHENLQGTINSCTQGDACPNTHGEGGSAGSTFTVGEGSNLLGIHDLPAERNRFYDIHVMGMRGTSLLHDQNMDSCRQECLQYYDCGGTPIGPVFTISRDLYKDILVGEGLLYDVTKVDLEKSE